MSKLIHKILFTFLLLQFCAKGQFHTYRQFNHKDGLPMASLSSIDMTNSGALLLGTDGGGIIRFDGNSFAELRPPNGAEYTFHVTSIARRTGKIYFSDLYKGFVEIDRRDNNKITILKTKQPSESIKIFALESNLLGVNRGEIYLEQDGIWKMIHQFPNKTARNELIHSIETDKNILLFTTAGNYYFSKSSLTIGPLTGLIRDKKYSADFKFGYALNGTLTLFDESLTNFLKIIDFEDESPIYDTGTIVNSPSDGKIVSAGYNDAKGCFTFLTNDGRILEWKNNELTYLDQNTLSNIVGGNTILADRNGDYWVTSSQRGLYKVSLEPFTRLQFHSAFLNPHILFTHITEKGTLLFSTVERETYIGNMRDLRRVQQIPMRLTSATKLGENLYFGSSDGLLLFDENSRTFSKILNQNFEGKLVLSAFTLLDKIYLGVANDGLYEFDPEKKSFKKIQPTGIQVPKYFYTFQKAAGRNELLCGTNDGVYRYNPSNDLIEKINESAALGSYCGLSVTDKFGTRWFTLDQGLLGILSDGQIVSITDSKFFPSFLFYTLNTDKFGNLILGTNKGLNFLQVNEMGKVVGRRSFAGTTGFDGYETHMRSQFQNDDYILLGTIEGLFIVNPEILYSIRAPLSPGINRITGLKTYSDNTLGFKFIVNHSKLPTVYYSYRLSGIRKSEWSEWSSINEVIFDDLPGGSYILEVRASYDKIHFSPTSSRTVIIEQPFYKRAWFIGLVIFVLVVFNFTLISRMRKIEEINIFGSQDTYLTNKLTPAIILFGLIGNTTAHLLAPYFAIASKNQTIAAILLALFLSMLYALSIYSRNKNHPRILNVTLILAFLSITAFNYYGVFVSELHPFYVLALILVLSITPFIFNQLRSVILIGLVVLILAGLLIVVVKEPTYNRYLFLIIITIQVCLFIFMSYLRFDSISKLSFISGVINNGNVPTLAYNKSGVIIYASENINRFFPCATHELLGKHINTLVNFLIEDEKSINQDLESKFDNGSTITLPFLQENNKVIWIEWSCTLFKNDVMVILGQNVTDKLELQNTYELLVQNAEDFIYQVDVQGDFVFVNDRFFDRLGYRNEELVGKNSMNLIPESHRESTLKYYNEHFRERKGISYNEFPIIKKNGELIWIGQYVTTLYMPGSKKMVNGFLALARDITEKKKQSQIIETQSKDITSSINYAKRIQDNLLPGSLKLDESFAESFIFYRPKDIVSGDFYWMERVDKYTVFALADSTGHGVPGAFMSLLGINLLNSIVKEHYHLDPGKILNQIDKKLKETLPRKHKNIIMNDGMEVTLCIFDHDNNRLTFACAGSRFLIFDGNSFNMYKGDNKHIGDEPQEDFKGYVSHIINLNPNNTLYLFTDGFQDQFGGRRNKKYSFKRLLELLEANIRLDLVDQLQMIEEEFDEWMGDVQQTDDVTIIAIRGIKP